LNIDEIINSNNDQLYEHAKNIKQRIDELIENLGNKLSGLFYVYKERSYTGIY
jgi:hypothetical protein